MGVDFKSTKKKEKGSECMTNTELLEAKIEASGYKKSYIAEKIGLSPYGFAKKVRNDNEFKTSEVNALCELLGIDSLEEKEQIFFANKVD